MRRVPVLTLASLVAVLALFAAPVNAATLFGTDTPDVRMAPGFPANSVFDLDDFFDSATGATIGYTASGASVDANGVVTVPAGATAGQAAVSFTATAGGESITVDSVAVTSNGLISNVPGIDNNNRLAGVSGGNAFLNAIVPGSSVASVDALALVGGTGELTGSSATGSAALLATIGQVSVSQTETGLYVRSSEVKAEGAGSAAFGGLTATIAADGSYTLAADANFAGPFVVTLGNTADAVHVLAAKATNVAMEAATFMQLAAGTAPAADVSFANGAVTITADAGEGALFVANAGVAAGADATVSLNYNSSSAGASIAVVGFDAASIADLPTGAANKIAYELITGADFIQTGVVKNVAATMKSKSGSVLPGFQVFNPGTSAITVTISNLQVINVGPLANYAVIANAKAPVASLGIAFEAALAGESTENHFAGGTAGSIALDGTSQVVNLMLQASGVDAGLYTAECWVKKLGGAGTFYLHVTDGAKETRAQAVDFGADWEKVTASGLAKAGSLFVVVQSSGANFVVDDVTVRLLKDTANVFDYALLGL